ncbi:uncharacterized protein VTP21DRAFT_174 [Calcarisporiella thermophila]|uniref:uncharacterized protein n=1 Tax=Calcarisporiella thermophila TaxID=911321 RepID=UPI003742C9D5
MLSHHHSYFISPARCSSSPAHRKVIAMESTAEVLSHFKLVRLLNEDPITKSVILLGKIHPSASADSDAGENAILRLEKSHFHSSELPQLTLGSRIASLHLREKNDIYHWLTGMLARDEDLEDVKMELIYPCTDAHIKKYSAQSYHLFNETPEIYAQVVRPFIEAIPTSRIQWVYNIIEEKAEVDSFVMHDRDPETGFVLVPDSKWDKKTLESLYLQVIVNRRDIASLRSLHSGHLPLLKNIREKVLKVVPATYPGVGPEQLRLFVHYQPSYYHFHVHVTHVHHDPAGAAVGRAHLLETIIDHLEHIDPMYYQKCTLTYVVGENQPLFPLLKPCLPR